LTADFREAQRQLATIEELNKTRSTTRADLDRARDRANDLDRRIDLLRQRQALLGRQIEEQGPLDETILLRFGRLSIETPQPGGVAAIEIAPRAPRR
jgi:chromosome segregation ATPase